MCLRHGEDKISIRRNTRGQLPRCEVGRVTTQPRQDLCRFPMNRMRGYRAGPGASRREIRNLNCSAYAAASRSAVGDRQMFPVHTKSTCRANSSFQHGRHRSPPERCRASRPLRNLYGGGPPRPPVALTSDLRPSGNLARLLGRPSVRDSGLCKSRHADQPMNGLCRQIDVAVNIRVSRLA